MVTDSEKLQKLQINLSKKALSEIEKIRERTEDGSKTQVIKSSLKLYNFITEEKSKDKGLKLLLRDSEGNTREIII